MISNNEFEKNNFRTLIENDEIGDVDDRLNVIDTFLDTEEHVTLEDMMKLLRGNGFDYDEGFVRQCMNRWVAHGFAQKEKFEGQPPRYEHRHLGKHHDHLICTKCGKIDEFSNNELERLQLKITNSSGFHMLQHKMEIYGICSECLKRRVSLMSLAMAQPGETVVIKEVMGGKAVRSRLTDMGLRPGDILEIISNNSNSRLIIAHDCARVALGRGIAQKIMVSLAPPDQVVECEEP